MYTNRYDQQTTDTHCVIFFLPYMYSIFTLHIPYISDESYVYPVDVNNYIHGKPKNSLQSHKVIPWCSVSLTACACVFRCMHNYKFQIWPGNKCRTCVVTVVLRTVAFLLTFCSKLCGNKCRNFFCQLRDVSLFSGGKGYHFFKTGLPKILTLPLNTNKKVVTLPTSILYFLKHYCPE